MRGHMKKKQVIQILCATGMIVAAVSVTAFAGTSTLKVTTQTITSAGITQSVKADGYVESENEKIYYASVSAPIETFSLENGDVVEEGEKLVSFDAEDLDYNATQAKLQAEALEAGYKGSVQQTNELAAAYQNAQAQDAAFLQIYQATLQNVNDVQLNIALVGDAVENKSDAIQIKIAQLQAEILQKNALAADDSLTAEDRNDYQEQAAWMEVEVAKLQKQLLELDDTGATPIENRYFQEAEMFLNEVNVQRSMLQQEIASTKHAGMNESQLAQMEKNTAAAQETVTWSEGKAQKAKDGVTAEFAGVVSEVCIKEGAYVAEGTPLFTVKDHHNLRVVVEVTSHEMGQIQVGQMASITIGGKTYEGEVSKIRMETVTDAQNKAKLQVEVHINNSDGTIYLGTDADVVIQTGSKDETVLIPNTALYADDGGDYCYVLVNGVIEKRYIICSLVGEEMTEVSEGLANGEQVITQAMTDDKIGKNAQSRN